MWQVVGLAQDPVPGDPVAVHEGGQSYLRVAEAMLRAAAVLRGLDSGASSGAESVTALLENRDEITGDVMAAQQRYQAAGDALVEYATVLDGVQQDVHAARVRAQMADDAARDDEALARRYRQRAVDARNGGEVNWEEVQRLSRLEEQYRASAQDERDVVTQQTHAVQEAVAILNQAAKRAIDQIEQITANDGLNDSWWDNWGSKLIAGLTKVAELVATVAGIAGLLLCWVPGLGAALFAVSAVAGVLAAAGNVVLAAAGDQSWRQGLLAVGYGLLGCVGLGGLRGILASIKGGAQFFGKGGAAALGEAFRNGLPALKTTIASFAARLKHLGDGVKGPAPRPADPLPAANQPPPKPADDLPQPQPQAQPEAQVLKPDLADFPAQKLDPTNVANGPRLAIQLLAQQMSRGHSWKHVEKFKEFPGITTHQQFADLIETAITKGEHYFLNPEGRHLYWYEGMFVVKNPKDLDGGTAFVPPEGYTYFITQINNM